MGLFQSSWGRSWIELFVFLPLQTTKPPGPDADYEELYVSSFKDIQIKHSSKYSMYGGNPRQCGRGLFNGTTLKIWDKSKTHLYVHVTDQ